MRCTGNIQARMGIAAGWRGLRSPALNAFTCWRTGSFVCNGPDFSCIVMCQTSKIHWHISCQDLTYNKKYDNSLRQATKSGGAPEAVLEHEQVKEQVSRLLAVLKNEEAEQKALAEGAAANTADPDHAEDELQEVRKPPSQHSEGSEKYWKAVGNQSVRTYCSLHVQPKTSKGIISLVSQMV